MEKGVTLKSIKTGKLGIEGLEQVLHSQEIITGNKIWFLKDLLMQWLFTKHTFFLTQNHNIATL